MTKYARVGIGTLTLLMICAFGPVLPAKDADEHIIINTPKPYTNVVDAIQRLGGKVNRQFQYIDAISADIPSSAMPAVRDLVGDDAIDRDDVIHVSKPVRNPHDQRTKQVKTTDFSDIYTTVPVGKPGTPIFGVKQVTLPSDQAYSVNAANINLRGLHAAGYTGKGIVVAVVDSGVKPHFASLEAGDSVIGGEDFVGDCSAQKPADTSLGDNCPFSSPSNDPHGTFVSALISGNARIPLTSDSSIFSKSMNKHFPGALESAGKTTYFDMIGSAPESQIFAVRVFGPGAGAEKSTVIAALESVITQRKNFDKHGQWTTRNSNGGYNIKVCNLSLGTSTTYAGHTELERLLDTMIANDIVPVVAAGDGGPSSLTISSPATSFSALAVGATSPAANNRVETEVFHSDLTRGLLFRPDDDTETAILSSRGVTADGRILPHVMAGGIGMVSQGCGLDGPDNTGNCTNVNSLDIADGTSFSAPIVSGVAAILRQKFPNASAGQIWNAIVNAANNKVIGDGSTVLDQGQGVVNAAAAANLLQSNRVSDNLPAPPRKPDSLVSNNIEANTDLEVVSGTARQRFSKLQQGQRGEVLYQVDPNTSQVVIDLTNVKFVAPDKQNQLFGDDVLFTIQTSKTSSGGFGDYFLCVPEFVYGDTHIVIPDPSCPFPELLEPGVMRITAMGDSTNGGNTSIDISVTSSKDPLPKTTVSGKIRGGDNQNFPITIPRGTKVAEFDLRWNQDWAHYPTNDLDMYLTDPSGVVDFDGVTLNSPEHVVVNNPTPGTWNVLVQGFSVSTKTDNFVLSVVLDGKPVKQ